MRSRIARRIKRMRKKIPGTMTVTLTPVAAANVQGTAVLVPYAEKRPMEHKEQRALEVDIDAKTIVWHLWVEDLKGQEPERGWLITDPSGNKWQVRDATLELLEQRYRLPCIKLFV